MANVSSNYCMPLIIGSSKYLSTARVVTFSTTIFFSLIVMSLSANLISLTMPAFYFNFSALALATALLSLLTVAIMLVVDRLRQGSIFSYIVVEIVWLSILWVLWLITGSYAAWTDGQLIAALPSESSCDFGLFADSNDASNLSRDQSHYGFLLPRMDPTDVLHRHCSWYLAIRAKGRGNSAWTTGVRDGVLFYSIRKTMEGAAQVQAAQATMPYPLPPPQQPYPPYPSSYPIPQV
ncbi:hypothetical protein F5888DRAFT_975674 [Russula emetica]|nr:hypothetical protein F5888DRAFT_975674 [Russula emetica]